MKLHNTSTEGIESQPQKHTPSQKPHSPKSRLRLVLLIWLFFIILAYVSVAFYYNVDTQKTNTRLNELFKSFE